MPNKEENSILFSQRLFLIGLFAKQLYILPSGSFQLGDIFLVSSCLLSIISHKKNFIIYRDEIFLLLYVAMITIVNLVYSFIIPEHSFIRPIIYYIYNLIIVISFSFWVNAFDATKFMRKTSTVLKTSLIFQSALFISGVGRWAYGTRYTGSFNDPNQYGVFIFFSILIIFLLDNITNNSKWFIWCVIGTILVLPSTSTGTMLGVLLFWVGAYVFKIKHMEKKERRIYTILIFFLMFALLIIYSIQVPLPAFITNNKMYIRVFEKIAKVSNTQGDSSLLQDRGWTTVANAPHYLIYGAGEGAFDRFDASQEVHSSFIGPLFYYGIIPFIFLSYWMFRKIKGTPYTFIYISFFAEALFLVNTRQPLYWIIIVLGNVSVLTYKNREKGYICHDTATIETLQY